MKISRARVERWLWYAFLATAAWQTRSILWQADTAFIEWRSASLFVSDALMLSLMAMWLYEARPGKIPRPAAGDWLLGFLIASSVLSLGAAEHVGVGVYGVIRVVQYVLFYLYIRMYALGRFDAGMSAVAFVVGALAQAVLGIAQYVLQRDVGLRWFGETLLRTDMRGVAVFYDLTHEKILRAYGTLPHPNVLALYLMVALWVLVWLWVRLERTTGRESVLWRATASVLLVGMYLTFSRTVIAVWVCAWAVLAVCIWWPHISGSWPHITEVRRRLAPMLITLAVVSLGVAALLWPQVTARMTIAVTDEAVQQRLKYNAEAISSGGGWALHVNWTGVGIGNFTSWLARFDRALPSFVTQPAHNVYALAYSEIGVLGLGVLLAWLGTVLLSAWKVYRDEPFVRAGMIALVSALLLVAMLDHFFWTLQQGRIIWWGVLALAAGAVTIRPSVS